MDLTDMIRRYLHYFIILFIIMILIIIIRGVLDTGAHIGAIMNSTQVFDPPSFDPLTDKYRAASRPQTNSRTQGVDSMRKPSWLLGLGSSNNNSNNSNNNNNSNSQTQTRTNNSTSTATTSSSSSGLSLGYPLLEGGLRRYFIIILIIFIPLEIIY